MFGFIMFIAALFIVWLYISSGFVVGAFATLLFLVVLYAKRFTAFCMIKAYRAYAVKNKEKAINWFEKGYKHGMNVKQKVTFSYYLLREGKTERAEEVLGSILGFGAAKPEERNLAKSHHALVLMKTGREEEALEELLEIFPTYRNSTIYGSIGYLYILLGDMQKAEEFNLEAYDYNSDDKVILDNMVQLYNKLENAQKAFEFAEKLMEKKPTFVEAYYNAAIAAKGVGKYGVAREYLERTEGMETTFLSNVSHDDIKKLLEELPN